LSEAVNSVSSITNNIKSVSQLS